MGSKVSVNNGIVYKWLDFICCVVQNGVNAASLAIAEQYVQAFSKLAKTTNTILLPEKTGDVSSMVAQVCLCVYGEERATEGWGVEGRFVERVSRRMEQEEGSMRLGD